MQFVFDLDGTICFKGQPVSEKLLDCIEDLVGAGHEVIFASARPIRDMLPVLHERFHGFSLIGGNGSLISVKGKVTLTEPFSDEQVKQILAWIDEHQATYLIDSDWDYAYTGAHDHPILNNVDVNKLAKLIPIDALRSFVKILILTANDMEILTEKVKSLGVVVHQHINENVIDISPPNIHKWNALQKLGVKEGHFIAFGNDANDIPMFEKAAHRVMIGHHNELSAYATESIPMDENCELRIMERLTNLAAQYPIVT